LAVIIKYNKTGKVLFYLSAVAPWCLLIAIVSFYIHTSTILKRLPSYNNPDPKEMAVYDFYNAIIDKLDAPWGFSIAVWLICLLIFLRPYKLKEYKLALFISTIGHIGAFIVILSPIGEWYLD